MVTLVGNRTGSEGDEKRSLLHQQQLLLVGFLGGIAFTALVLVLQEQRIFEVAVWPFTSTEYFDLLIILIAMTSSACIFSSFALTGIVGAVTPSERLRRFAIACLIIGLCGLLIVLPLLLLIFTKIGAAVIFAFEVVLLVSLLLSLEPGKKPDSEQRL